VTERALDRIGTHRPSVAAEPGRHEGTDADPAKAIQERAEPAIFLVDEREKTGEHGASAVAADPKLSTGVNQNGVQNTHGTLLFVHFSNG
jgi:hypothetical protein